MVKEGFLEYHEKKKKRTMERVRRWVNTGLFLLEYSVLCLMDETKSMMLSNVIPNVGRGKFKAITEIGKGKGLKGREGFYTSNW